MENIKSPFGVNATARIDNFSLGGDWARSSILGYDFQRQGALETTSTAQLNTLTASTFAEGVLIPAPFMTLVPGLRLQNYWLDNEPYQSVEPRVAADFHLQKGNSPLTMKTGVGLFSQAAPEVERAIAAVEGLTLPIQNPCRHNWGSPKALRPPGIYEARFIGLSARNKSLKKKPFQRLALIKRRRSQPGWAASRSGWKCS